MKIACVIPARLKSTRFPHKMLARLKDKPLLQWVWEAAQKTGKFDSIHFAVDSLEVANLVQSFGAPAILTSEACASGTDRLVELMLNKKIDADIWVNWQGDEPFINLETIENLLQTCHEKNADVWTLCKEISKKEEIESPQFVKVVCDNQGYALYFSRSPIPFYREKQGQKYFKHVGIYAYSKEALQKISTLSPSYLEEAEKLEQLRFLSNQMRIRVHETKHEVIGIDLPEHLIQAERFLEING